MKQKFRFLHLPRTTLLALAIPALSQPLAAASVYWANTGTNFNAGASWLGGVAPDSADIATFAGGKVTNPVLSAPASVSGLSFSNAAAVAYTVSGSALTLGSGGIDAAAVTAGTNAITAPLILAAGGETWKAGTGSTLAINPSSFSRLAGAAVTIDRTAGAGPVSSGTLANTNGILGAWAAVHSSGTSANNSPDGDTFAFKDAGNNLAPFTSATPVTATGAWGGVPSGGTGVENYDASGTTAVTGLNRNVNTIRYTGPGASQPGNVNPVGNVLTINGFMNAGSGEFFIGGTGGSNQYPINVTVGSSLDLVLAAKSAGITLRAGGGILNNGGGASSVTVTGPSTVTLAGASSYTGQTTVAGGTLLVSGAGSINTSSGIVINGADAKLLQTSTVASTPPVSLRRGTLDGTGVLGAVTVDDNLSATIANGNGGTAPLTLGTLTFNGKATLNLNSTAGTPLAVSGALATTPANGKVVIHATNPVPNGLLNLISFGSFGGSAADFTTDLTGLGARQTAGAPQISGNNIAVSISGEAIVWTGLAGEAWTTAASGDNSGPNDWVRKVAKTPTNFWTSDAVEFNDTYNAGAGNVPVSQAYVRLDSAVSPSSTVFNNDSVPYVLDSFDNGISSGSLTKNGAATTTLVGPHTYTGPTTINAGTLQLGDDTFIGTISSTASVTNNGTLRYYWKTDGTAAYPISGTGNLVKANDGILTLAGANTYSGTTTISGGAVTVNGNGNLGGGAVSVAAGTNLNLGKNIALAQTFTGGGTVTDTGGTVTISGDFSGFSGTYRHSSATASTVLTSTTATSANAAYEITVGNTTSQGILPNVTTGNNTFALGSLSGVVNSVVRNGGAVTGITTLQIGNLGTNTEFAGTIGGGGGTLALTKVGAGTLTLSGPATYNGATTVSQGTLRFTSSPKALGASAFAVANGAGLAVKTAAADSTPLTTASLTLGSSNLAFDFNNIQAGVPQISTGALAINGPAAVTILNANALLTGSYKLIDYTSLSGAGSLPAGSFPVGTRGTASIVNNAGDTSIDLVVSADTPKWTGLDNGNWVTGSTGPNKNWKLASSGSATDYIQGDSVLFDDSAAGTTNIAIPVDVSPLATVFNNSAKAYTLSGAGGIASGPLLKGGGGSTTLLTTNTYSGATTISAGTLRLGNGTVDGTIANTASVVNNGTLAYDWAADHTAPYVISGAGNLTKAGAGKLTVTAANSYTGTTTLTGGALAVAGAGTPGTGAIALGAGTTLNIDTNLALANTVSGSGSVINTGNTAVTGDFGGFSGAFTHNSTVVSVSFNTAAATSANAAYNIASEQGSSQGMIAAGNGDYTLKLGALGGVANSLFRGGNTATGITTLEIGNLGTSTEFAGSINNGVTKSIALSKVGGGTLTLSGASNYSGATVVYAGSLNVTGSLSPASVVTVTSGGKLTGSGTVAGTVVAGGTVAPGANVGTLTTGPATLNGALAIEIDGAAADKLVSTGSLNVSGAALTVSLLGGGFAAPSYVIAEGTSITGPFASVPAGYAVTIVAGGAGQQAVLTKSGAAGYGAWAAANAGGGPASGDHDKDGVQNGAEYFMNSAPGFTANPKIAGGAVTWPNGGNIPASAYGSQFVVQTSPNLATWTNVPAGSLTTNTNSALTYTVPTGQGKIFVRLKVTPN